VYHQFDDFEAGNRQFHDGGQKHQRALLGKFLGACLFDPDQDPVGAQPLALIFVKINFVAGLCMIWRRKVQLRSVNRFRISGNSCGVARRKS
jgi:hypothetical protein